MFYLRKTNRSVFYLCKHIACFLLVWKAYFIFCLAIFRKGGLRWLRSLMNVSRRKELVCPDWHTNTPARYSGILHTSLFRLFSSKWLYIYSQNNHNCSHKSCFIRKLAQSVWDLLTTFMWNARRKGTLKICIMCWISIKYLRICL